MFERKRNFQAIFRDPSGRVVASRRTATMKEAVTVARQNVGVAANVDVRNLSTGGYMTIQRGGGISQTISARPAPTTTMTRAQVQAQPHMQPVVIEGKNLDAMVTDLATAAYVRRDWATINPDRTPTLAPIQMVSGQRPTWSTRAVSTPVGIKELELAPTYRELRNMPNTALQGAWIEHMARAKDYTAQIPQTRVQTTPARAVQARSQGSGIFGAMNAADARMGSKIRW